MRLGTLASLLVILICLCAFTLYRNQQSNVFDFPPGLEFIYVRHGQSAINKPLNEFNHLTDVFCQCSSHPEGAASCEVPEEVCGKENKVAQNANNRALWISKYGTQRFRNPVLPKDLVSAAKVFLGARELFDSPLTKEGLLAAARLNNGSEGLQMEWLAQQLGQIDPKHLIREPLLPNLVTDKKTVLVSSNLIRAVDTLLNGLTHLAVSGLPLYLHTALQEYSASGNGDVVSVFLPLGLQHNSKSLLGIDLWKRVSKLRFEGYRDAGMLGAPWAPKTEIGNMTWWHQRDLKLASVDHLQTDHLVNHDYFLPNSRLEEEYYRQPPPAAVETVKLGIEYSKKDDELGTVRFHDFFSWMHDLYAKHEGLERMVVVGHSLWFRDFVAYAQKHGGLSDPSCRAFSAHRLRNTAMLKISHGKCICLFDGERFGGTCVGSN